MCVLFLFQILPYNVGGTLLALTRVGNLTCYLIEHKLIKLSLQAGSERNPHLLNLLGRIENSTVQRVILIGYPKLVKCR